MLPYIQQSLQQNSLCTSFNPRLNILHYPNTSHNSAPGYGVEVKYSATIFRAEVRIYTDSSCIHYPRMVLVETVL